MFDTRVSAYVNAKDQKGFSELFKVSAVIDSIRNGQYEGATNMLRSLSDKAEIKEFKEKRFVGVIWSGVCSPTRADKNLRTHSGLFCLDIDHLPADSLISVRRLICQDDYTFLCFISPSGKGLKVVIKIGIDSIDEHRAFFKQLQSYYLECYNLPVDEKCSNESRLCFLPYDPEIYVNENSQTFYLVDDTDKKAKPESEPVNANSYHLEAFNWCLLVHNKKHQFSNGSRNGYVTALANFCNDYGIDKDLVIQECVGRFVEEDFKEKEILATIRSIYHNKRDQHGKKQYEKISFNSDRPKNGTENKSEGVPNSSRPESGTSQKRDTPPAANFSDTPLIPLEVYENLPNLLKEGCSAFTDQREKDVFLTGALGVLSGCFHSVTGVYDQSTVSTNIYNFIVAPAASGKGAMVWAKRLAMSFHKRLIENSKADSEAYEFKVNEWEVEKKKNKGMISDPKPEEPPFQMLFFPANSSAASVVQNLNENDGCGIVFESEADTLSGALSQDWGNYSDMLRKAFHHEPVTYLRKTNKEYIEVERPQLSVCLSGTPAQVQRLIPNTEDGLFSRFLFYCFSSEPHWRDVSPKAGRIPLNDHFAKLDSQVLEMMEYSLGKPVTFQLQPEHWNKINESFQDWLDETVKLVGYNAVSPIKRLGLVAFRLAMLLTIIRRFENGDLESVIICDDQDFEVAMQLVSIYREHAMWIFEHLPTEEPEEPIAKLEDKMDKIRKALEMHKQGKSVRDIAEELGIPKTTVHRWVTSK